MDNRVIVVGNNHHNTLGVLRSLGERGIKPELIITDDTLKFVTTCKYVGSIYTIHKAEEVVLILQSLKQSGAMPIVICCDDKSIAEIDKHYDELSKYFHLPNAGQQGRINFLMSKLEQQKLANKAGLLSPRTWRVYGNTTLPTDVVYPCIVKTDSSIDGGKIDIKVCYNRDELQSNTSRSVEYIIQEYIEKEYELNVVACSLNNGKDIVVPGVIHKIREYPAKGGSSSFSVLKNCNEYPHLPLDGIKRMLELTQYEGLFSIEFVCKDGLCYFLEVNFRNDGNGYVPTSAGCNLHYIWCCHKSGVAVEDFSVHTPHYFMADVRDILHVIKDKQLKVGEWLNDFRRTDCFLLYNRRDSKPFRVYMRSYLGSVFHSLCKKIRICRRV